MSIWGIIILVVLVVSIFDPGFREDFSFIIIFLGIEALSGYLNERFPRQPYSFAFWAALGLSGVAEVAYRHITGNWSGGYIMYALLGYIVFMLRQTPAYVKQPFKRFVAGSAPMSSLRSRWLQLEWEHRDSILFTLVVAVISFAWICLGVATFFWAILQGVSLTTIGVVGLYIVISVLWFTTTAPADNR